MSDHFPRIDPKPSFPALEHEILRFWKAARIFERSVEERAADRSYVFYDGPPFANGYPHYGHILTSYVKDTVPRYFTMRGYRVERRFGWDCHGLPAENEVEKELGIRGKQQIDAYGVERFNQVCREVVLRYTAAWESVITRIGRWVDFEHDYKTMDLPYMETVLWIFKTLHDRGFIYEGHKVVHYCYRCETPLANFEAKQDDAYRDRDDPSVTVRFELDGRPDTALLAWTTTPWTLPSNLALAVGKDIAYVTVAHQGKKLILARARLPAYAKQLGEQPEILCEENGESLAGSRYRPLFPYFAGDREQGAFRVLLGDFVTTDDGTGVVHMAPAFGEDDQVLCEREQIEARNPVDSQGRFTAAVTDFAGRNVHEANADLVRKLRELGALFEWGTFRHAYPHCWRCDTPLIYRAIPSWYVKVTAFKEAMLRANQGINWVPAHIKDGSFGKWLEGARDWAISRNRYWGAPIPVWRCDRCAELEVFGSVAELGKRAQQAVTDLHRPAIDAVTFRCRQCNGTMRRVPEVLDCWFESGAMPYGQQHYPFENKAKFEAGFPCDFIVEYISQTRGWFYTLVVLGTALFDRAPFKNVICHGVVLAEDGRKMSKRLKNYPEPQTVLDRYGSDAMRIYLIGGPILRGADLRFSEAGVEDIIKRFLLPLTNSASLFTTYANVDRFVPQPLGGKPVNPLDSYLLSELQLLIRNVDQAMAAYDLMSAAGAIEAFIDTLTNWYIRRSRRRFWKNEQDQDKAQAYQTLYHSLVTLVKVLAPFAPFLAEHLYQALTGEESVHLAAWPQVELALIDPELSDEVAQVRTVLRIGRNLREKKKIKVRQPLRQLTVAGVAADIVLRHRDEIAEEMNVKEVLVERDPRELATKVVKCQGKVLGPRLGAAVQKVIAAGKAGNYRELPGGCIEIEGHLLEPGDYEVEFVSKQGFDCAAERGVVVALDTKITEQLLREGWAREIIRSVQAMRKEAGYQVTDRIKVSITGAAPVLAAVREFQSYIEGETLSQIVDAPLANADATSELKLDQHLVQIAIKR
ncbi:MAG: isoleucine--tRNA ligase [Planctomycetota bacterium]